MAECLDYNMNRHIESGTALIFQLSSLMVRAQQVKGSALSIADGARVLGIPSFLHHDLCYRHWGPKPIS